MRPKLYNGNTGGMAWHFLCININECIVQICTVIVYHAWVIGLGVCSILSSNFSAERNYKCLLFFRSSIECSTDNGNNENAMIRTRAASCEFMSELVFISFRTTDLNSHELPFTLLINLSHKLLWFSKNDVIFFMSFFKSTHVFCTYRPFYGIYLKTESMLLNAVTKQLKAGHTQLYRNNHV